MAGAVILRRTERAVLVDLRDGTTAVIFRSRRGRIIIRRRGPRGFVRPAPEKVCIVCAKHVETKEHGVRIECDGQWTWCVEAGVNATLDEVYEFLADAIDSCRYCTACHEFEYYNRNCENLCYAAWEVLGVEARGIPPDKEGDCVIDCTWKYSYDPCRCEAKTL